jgi:rRNA maturation RNase YbeY
MGYNVIRFVIKKPISFSLYKSKAILWALITNFGIHSFIPFMASIFFHSADRPFAFKHKQALKAFLAMVFNQEHRTLKRVDYIFCSDAYLLKINQQFLQHDTYTDIITFDLTEPTAQGIEAEIYISVDRVKANALEHNTRFTDEIVRVLVHGILHLCGYNDKTPKEQTLMREKEAEYLNLFESL